MTNVAPTDPAASKPEPRENQLLIVLADISGYTDLMVSSQTAAMHGQMIVTMLIESILEEVEIPLTLQEIEGDAVFLYAEHPGDEEGWRAVCDEVGQKLLRFFVAFAEAIVEAEESTLCQCAVCLNPDLRLKVIAHSGEAVFHEIRGRAQVSGVDVITAHRLLKNSVPGHEYILLTEPAHRLMGDSLEIEFSPGKEHYDGIGDVSTYVHIPNGQQTAISEFYAQPAGRLALRGVHFSFWVIVEELKVLFGSQPGSEANAGPLRRAAFNAMIVFVSPFVFVTSLAIAPVKLLIQRKRQAR